ncbi:MAG TPA: NADH-quinone oxidoreductase subunit J [Pantanalinema sp.]
MLSTILFYLLATVMVLGGFVTITRRHPLPAALSMVVSFMALSGLYALLSAQLIAILQILVYAGAIVALIVFVIMLLNVREENLDYHEAFFPQLGLAVAGLVPVVGLVLAAINKLPKDAFPPLNDPAYGSIELVGMFLYQNYVFVFEMVSILLTVAMVGVVLLAKRRI